MLRKSSLLIVLTIILAIPGCSQKENAPEPSSDYVLIENVPFVKQQDNYCGPAAMASLMQFLGQVMDQNTVVK